MSDPAPFKQNCHLQEHHHSATRKRQHCLKKISRLPVQFTPSRVGFQGEKVQTECRKKIFLSRIRRVVLISTTSPESATSPFLRRLLPWRVPCTIVKGGVGQPTGRTLVAHKGPPGDYRFRLPAHRQPDVTAYLALKINSLNSLHLSSLKT